MKAPHYRRFNSKSDMGRNAELALVARLKKDSIAMAFRTPGSKGAADVIELRSHTPEFPSQTTWTADVRLIQVRAGRKPSWPEVSRLEAHMRAESAFPCMVRVVWARKHVCKMPSCADNGPECQDGWEFEWL